MALRAGEDGENGGRCRICARPRHSATREAAATDRAPAALRGGARGRRGHIRVLRRLLYIANALVNDAPRRRLIHNSSTPLAEWMVAATTEYVGRRLAATGFLSANLICLAHERSQRRIDVGRSFQTKVMPKAERAEILDAPQEWMLGAATQPETRIEVRGANDSAGEAHPRLNDDPTLLRVGFHWPTRTGSRQPTVPRCLALARLRAKVIGQRHPNAGVPEIPGDEAMPAPRTLPKRRLRCHDSSNFCRRPTPRRSPHI
jgi:hypothetical protein